MKTKSVTKLLPHDGGFESEAHRLRAAQIWQLYSQSRVGLIGALLGAIILVATLWNVVSHLVLVVWLASYALVQVARHVLISAFHRTCSIGRRDVSLGCMVCSWHLPFSAFVGFSRCFSVSGEFSTSPVCPVDFPRRDNVRGSGGLLAHHRVLLAYHPGGDAAASRAAHLRLGRGSLDHWGRDSALCHRFGSYREPYARLRSRVASIEI